MVNLKIDHNEISVPEGTTIMEAAALAGIDIPKLCYLKNINEIAACRVCLVEVVGKEQLVTSCNNKVQEGLEILTNSPRVRVARKQNVQLILSQHDFKCATCVRSGNCTLQTLSNDLNIIDLPFKERVEHAPWDKNFPLIRDTEKCIKCMRCIQVCDKVQGLGIWDVTSTGSRTTVNVKGNRKITDADCALCGQCITHCPVGALRERDDTEKVWDAIADEKKTVVVQIAPAVRTAWGEAMGMKREDATVGKILDAWKRMGADYVFDTSFSADLTIMEEATEFLERFQSGSLKHCRNIKSKLLLHITLSYLHHHLTVTDNLLHHIPLLGMTFVYLYSSDFLSQRSLYDLFLFSILSVYLFPAHVRYYPLLCIAILLSSLIAALDL